ncbi:hypothetical protein ONZ43_g4241 [Nemania bipapillata]|uniref:Uncharacterized protein n=1 Tax=Nemania bipapillata TaxID=110536 RepID=A0ACC2IQ81_9PEZI|nr:hypothetical protein ONZ43_g4241 [Nemania bipapillata]
MFTHDPLIIPITAQLIHLSASILSPNKGRALALLLRLLVEFCVLLVKLYELFVEIGILTMIYVWTVFLIYPAHFSLVGLGWALQPFTPDAVDLYLSVGLHDDR